MRDYFISFYRHYFSKQGFHGFIKRGTPCQVKKKSIVSFGLHRSGTTVIYQVLDRLFPKRDVLKVHHFLYAENCQVVATYRDFRDVLISQWRVDLKNLPDLDFLKKENGMPLTTESKSEARIDSEDKNKLMTNNDVQQYASLVKLQAEEVFLKYGQINRKEILWLRYESFFEDFNYLFSALERFFKITISQKQRNEIKMLCNIDANRERANRMNNFREYDVNTKIHGNHIYDGSIGSWKKVLNEEQVKIANGILGDYIRQFGYEM